MKAAARARPSVTDRATESPPRTGRKEPMMAEDLNEDIPETDTDATALADQTVAQADLLENLQKENEQLRAKLDELAAARQDQEALSQRLEQAEQAGNQLRQRYKTMALSQAVNEAAGSLGISPEAAGMYSSRFSCELDGDGQLRIEPNPTELLVKELRANPLLRQSADRGRQQRQAAAVVNGAADIEEADPVELITALDRKPARKAQFITRHGAQAFVDLAEAARRKGYKA